VSSTRFPARARAHAISNFWFQRTRIVQNHLADYPLARAVPDAAERAPLKSAALSSEPGALPIEAVVRGYLIGRDGRTPESGAVCGLPCPLTAPGGSVARTDFHAGDQSRNGSHDENILQASRRADRSRPR
jgi:phosphoribosylaminoimidazole-succinocarboxamide synthase